MAGGADKRDPLAREQLGHAQVRGEQTVERAFSASSIRAARPVGGKVILRQEEGGVTISIATGSVQPVRRGGNAPEILIALIP
jgi:hypothetical protein